MKDKKEIEKITIEEKLKEIKEFPHRWKGLHHDLHNIYIPDISGDKGYREFIDGLYKSLKNKGYYSQENHGYPSKASYFIEDSQEEIPVFEKKYGNSLIQIIPKPFLQNKESKYYIKIHYPHHGVEKNKIEKDVEEYPWQNLISKTIIDIEDYLIPNNIPHFIKFYLYGDSIQIITFLEQKDWSEIFWKNSLDP